jgi:hypothetical protein
MDLPRCDTSADALDLIKQSGRDYEIIARTIYGLEIACVRTGGDKLPPIVITAGSHAGEPAGVLAALSLIDTLETEHATYIVPLRDPFAWGGFARCLAYALGEEVVIETHKDAERLLAERGTVVYQEEEHSLIVSLIGDLAFVSMRPLPRTRGPRDIERRLNRVMRDKPELVRILAGKRACWPSNLTAVEGCGDFDRAFSVFMTSHGVAADLNRQFTFAYPPIEVACIRDLVDRVKPGLVLDLHESQSSQFFLFVGTGSYEEGEQRRKVASAITGAVAKQGGRIDTLDDLLARSPDLGIIRRWKEPAPGLIAGDVHSVGQGASFGAYCQHQGVTTAIAVETGRWKPVMERVEQQIVGSIAGISVFEKLSRA